MLIRISHGIVLLHYRRALLQYILVPVLRLAPERYRLETLQQRAPALVATVNDSPEAAKVRLP